MHHALSQNLCKASSQNPSLPTSCASPTLYIHLFPAFFYHSTLSNDLWENQHITLMACWDEGSQELYLLCATFAKAEHMDWEITAMHIMPWTGALCQPSLPDVCDWIVRSYKSIFIHQLGWIHWFEAVASSHMDKDVSFLPGHSQIRHIFLHTGTTASCYPQSEWGQGQMLSSAWQQGPVVTMLPQPPDSSSATGLSIAQHWQQ